ncbi:hypothetical protein SAMN06297251_10477 [Fulvimarina manganoxydans]|uniref:Uncharacterized protein n=1 Tax=Fulvimarina manganoxydans TaxID=937218 RepID=A0A1W2ACZ4_9HYPH|nr:hypothetical protein SAMN06297251_10477 [Fulvimarina manganoxydans]
MRTMSIAEALGIDDEVERLLGTPWRTKPPIATKEERRRQKKKAERRRQRQARRITRRAS